MDALREAQPLTDTPAVVLLDNDSRVTEGWLPPLLAAMADGQAVVTPLILEREGVDRGAAMRNHLYTGELPVVDVEDTPNLIANKPRRRAAPPHLPAPSPEHATYHRPPTLY